MWWVAAMRMTLASVEGPRLPETGQRHGPEGTVPL